MWIWSKKQYWAEYCNAEINMGNIAFPNCVRIWLHAGEPMHGKRIGSESNEVSHQSASIQYNLLFRCRRFNINNQITLYPSNYRGRPVNESNVQDYISNIVSKYLPPEQPPWHICIVPLTASSSSARAEETPAASPNSDVIDPDQTDAGTVVSPESSVRTKPPF